MNICIIYQDQYPWDVRIEKFADALIKTKHVNEVHILSRNRDNLEKFEQKSNRLFLHRLPSVKNKIINGAINFPAFFSLVWIRTISAIIMKRKIDLIVVRDLPLSPAALFLGAVHKLPVIVDMAENYPAMISSTWKYRGPKLLDFIIRNPFLLGYLEKLVCIFARNVIVVSRHSLNRLKKQCKKANLWVVGNTPNLDYFQSTTEEGIEHSDQASYKMVYTGYLEAHRGLQTAIHAVAQVVKKVRDFKFIIIGNGTYEPQLRKLSSELGIQEYVIFTGWIPHEEIYDYIGKAEVCIIPHYVTAHVDTTIPNKIFDYMLKGKPVISTNATALKDIVEETGCGITYEDRSVEQLTMAILKYTDPNERKTAGERGRSAVLRKYNWDVDQSILAHAVQKAIIS